MGLATCGRWHTFAATAAQVQGAAQIGLLTLALVNWSMADAQEDEFRGDPAAEPPHTVGWTSATGSSFRDPEREDTRLVGRAHKHRTGSPTERFHNPASGLVLLRMAWYLLVLSADSSVGVAFELRAF